MLLFSVFSCYLIVVCLYGHFIFLIFFFQVTGWLVGWLHWLFTAWAFSSCSEQGLSPRGACASHCGGFSCGAQILGGRGFGRCDAWTQLPNSMWNLEQGNEPTLPAWAGRFSATGPPGKSKHLKIARQERF